MKVGITGHQHLDSTEEWKWVEAAMRSELAKLPEPLVAISSLAVGADQLLAALVLESGGNLHAVLPYADIERSFSDENIPEYRRLAQRAEIEILNTLGTDEDAYLAAGLKVVDESDLLFAVWNGLPAGGKGGTADIVAYAEKQGIPLIHMNPVSRTLQVVEHKLARKSLTD